MPADKFAVLKCFNLAMQKSIVDLSSELFFYIILDEKLGSPNSTVDVRQDILTFLQKPEMKLLQ